MIGRSWLPLLLGPTLAGCAHIGLMPTRDHRIHASDSFEYALLANNAYGDPMYDGKSRWVSLPPDVSLVIECGNDAIGLAYSIFRKRAGGRNEYIFAFRGTEGVKGPEARKDWRYGNLRLEQQRASEPIVRAFADAHYRDDIVFAGHSLGGALALHNSTRVTGKRVYVFNTSPRFMPPHDYNASTDPSDRQSLVETGEVLSAIRIRWKGVPVTRVAFNCFGKGGPIFQHQMLRLAVCLTRIAASEPTGPAALRAQQYIDLNPWMLDATEQLRPVELEHGRGDVGAEIACSR